MNSKSLTLPIYILISFSFCLKAQRSPFDMNNSSSSMSGFVGAIINSLPTTTSVAPTSISYGSRSVFKMVPGNAVSFTPTVDVPVQSWSISPELPIGLSFNTSTGSISGTPSTSYLATGFPLTVYAITAKNGNESKEISIQIQVLATGENVWTVLNGVTGGIRVVEIIV